MGITFLGKIEQPYPLALETQALALGAISGLQTHSFWAVSKHPSKTFLHVCIRLNNVKLGADALTIASAL